ncbi:MAG: single-stranded DNA-binding protein [Clostridia bacterium]|nr:single-stranded DNA-binding protein [Clostridia bacterium]MDE7328919.1 single-stranded DNA-binding protein [Clostridia bacterium]
MNKVILIGNLTRDPESGNTQSGVAYCRFGLAVNRRFSRENNEVDYFNVVCWRGLADNCAKILAKGRKVCVSGSIQTRQYEQDGAKRTAFDIVAEEVEFLPSGNRNDDGAPQETEKRQSVGNSGLTPVEEELPF